MAQHDKETEGPVEAPGHDLAETEPAERPDPEARLAEAEAQAVEFRDQLLRTAAEMENVRRRAARDVENAHRYGIERFARELLAVADSLEMGLDAARQADADPALLEGFEATQRQLLSVFEKFGIAPVEAAGRPFDPEFHEAMAAQPAAGAEPNTVLAVVQSGWTIQDRLLRPARVIVARQPEEG